MTLKMIYETVILIITGNQSICKITTTDPNMEEQLNRWFIPSNESYEIPTHLLVRTRSIKDGTNRLERLAKKRDWEIPKIQKLSPLEKELLIYFENGDSKVTIATTDYQWAEKFGTYFKPIKLYDSYAEFLVPFSYVLRLDSLSRGTRALEAYKLSLEK